VASSSTTKIVLLLFRCGVVAMRSEIAIYWPRHGSAQVGKIRYAMAPVCSAAHRGKLCS
jgi:hypothetical protein